MNQAASVKREVKQGLTQRLRQRVGMGDTDSDTSSDSDDSDATALKKAGGEAVVPKKKWGSRRRGLMGRTISKGSSKGSTRDVEEGAEGDGDAGSETVKDEGSQRGGDEKEKGSEKEKNKEGMEGKDMGTSTITPAAHVKKMAERKRGTTVVGGLSQLEQSMPADAVLAKAGAAEVRCVMSWTVCVGLLTDDMAGLLVFARIRSCCHAAGDYHAGGCA